MSLGKGRTPLGFGPEVRLRKRGEFLAVQRSGFRHFSRHFIIFVRAGGCAVHSRVGITASKRIGNAVVRNRWKRLVREAYRHVRRELERRIGAVDIVVIARPGRPTPALDDVLFALRGAARRYSKQRGQGA